MEGESAQPWCPTWAAVVAAAGEPWPPRWPAVAAAVAEGGPWLPGSSFCRGAAVEGALAKPVQGVPRGHVLVHLQLVTLPAGCMSS